MPHVPARCARRHLAAIAWLVAIWSVVATSGCTSPAQWIANGFKVGPEYCRPPAHVADDWIDADDRRVHKDPIDQQWWTVFNDPVLESLIAEAYGQNLTLRTAGLRILQSRHLRAIAAGSVFPQSQQASASYSHNLTTGTGFDRHFSNWNGSFNLSWEIDFWGRFRRAVEAADADLDASVHDFNDVLVTLLADVAATYVDIRTLQRRLELTRRNVEAQQGTYSLAETRFRLGQASELDVHQSKSSLAQTQAAIPQLEIALRQSQNQLCILLGIPPIDLSQRLGKGPIPTAPLEIAVGIPADLLMRRPDVRSAERRLAAQSARIGIAESDLYPSITVTGNVGVTANQFDELFRSGSSFGSVGPSLRWNILNYGRILNNVRAQDAVFAQMLWTYRQAVLVANSEAENALIQFLNAQQRLQLQNEAALAADQANENLTALVREGEQIDFNRVFNIQNFKTAQESAAAQATGDVAQALISIYRALGGGWQSPPVACGPGIPLEAQQPPEIPQQRPEMLPPAEQPPPLPPTQQVPQFPPSNANTRTNPNRGWMQRLSAATANHARL